MLALWWKPIALISLVIALYVFADLHGRHSVQADWDSYMQNQKILADKQHLDELKASQKASETLQKQDEELRKELTTAKEKLTNELTKDQSYATCHVSANVVQLYEDVRTGKAD